MILLPSMFRLLLALAFTGMLIGTSAGARGIGGYDRIAWTAQQGAPSDIVAMAQTADGWLWIGATDGLFRFDGVTFERYSPPGHPGLTYARVVEMHAAENGELYVSYFPVEVGVVRRNGAFEVLPRTSDHRRTPPLSMAVDRHDALWTIGHGIRRFANGEWSTVEDGHEWTSEVIYSMLADQDGQVWAASPKGAWRLDRTSGRFVKVSDLAGGLAMSPNGEVWLVGRDGGPSARLAQPPAGTRRPPGAGAASSRRYGQFASDGTLWTLGCPDTACLVHRIGGDVAKVQPGRDADERIASHDGTAARESTALIEDREGNIWLHAQAGLLQFRPKRFLLPEPGPKLEGHYSSVAADRSGQLWIAEATSGRLWRLAQDGVLSLDAGPPVYQVASGRDGALLKADRRSITRVLDGTVETFPLPPGPDGKPVDRQVLGIVDDGKRIWTATAELGALGWSGGKWVAAAELGVPRGILLSQPIGSGKSWLALASGELVLHGGADPIRHDARLVGAATGIFPGKRLVLGGANGLAVLKDGRFHLLRSADPEVLRGVSGIAVTANGDRWLNGAKGVVHVRAGGWQRVLDQPGEALQYELFGAVDGYPGRSSTARGATAFSTDGRHAWFLTSTGIVGLDSADLRRNSAAPRPAVLAIDTDRSRFTVSGRVRLPPGSRNFRIRFTAPSLRQPGNTRFEYRLEGLDTDWRGAENRRTASYTNVAPGDYRFRVRAFNEDGVMSRDEAVVPITIEPSWVQGLPFKLLLAATFITIVVLLYRLRIRYLTRRITERAGIKMAERERIARTLHDTFLQAVYLMMLQLRRVERKLPAHEPAREELAGILDDARRVMDEGREQVHDLRIHPARSLEETLQDCACTLRELYPDVHFSMRVRGAAPAFSRPLAEECGAIAAEALRNAFTHAQARAVSVEIEYAGRGLAVEVIDDGEGMPADIASAGGRAGRWGLVGMRERAARIGASLDLRSEPGRGTTVRLALPLTPQQAGE